MWRLLLGKMGVQWIPFLMFETLNSQCRRKLACAKIMPNVGKNLSWCALLPTFQKNQKRKLVSSQIHLVHFPHLRGQLWGVTTSQYHSFLSSFWHVGLRRWGAIAYRQVECTAEFPFQFGHWRSFDLRLPIKFYLLDEKCFFIFVDCFFSNQRRGSEASELWRRKEFLLLCIRKACMLRCCALSRSLVKIHRQDTSLAHFFQNTSFSLFDFFLKGCCKVKKQI